MEDPIVFCDRPIRKASLS